MDTVANLLALLTCSIIGGAILGAGMAFGLRVGGESGWPAVPLLVCGIVAFAAAIHFLRT